MERARHAFGQLENVDSAMNAGKIDAYDILFVKNAEGKPFVGWIDAQGNKVICNENLEADFDALESEIATKASKEEVEAKVDQAVLDVIDIANAYTNAQIETKIAEVSNAFEVVEF